MDALDFHVTCAACMLFLMHIAMPSHIYICLEHQEEFAIFQQVICQAALYIGWHQCFFFRIFQHIVHQSPRCRNLLLGALSGGPGNTWSINRFVFYLWMRDETAESEVNPGVLLSHFSCICAQFEHCEYIGIYLLF